LSTTLGSVGIGSARSSCLVVSGGATASAKPWSAWPPEGPVPLGAIKVTNADTSGWSFQSTKISLKTATVTVTDQGQSVPVTVIQLGRGFGDDWALKFVPSGWKSQAGHAYAVTINGIAPPVTYTVEIAGCA